MPASESFFKLARVSVLQKLRNKVSFFDNANLANSVFSHQMFRYSIEKLEGICWLNDINGMQFVLIVALEESNRHFHRFDKIERAGVPYVDNADNILSLAVDEHVSIQKLKEVLQTFVQFIVRKFHLMYFSNIAHDYRTIFRVSPIKIERPLLLPITSQLPNKVLQIFWVHRSLWSSGQLCIGCGRWFI